MSKYHELNNWKKAFAWVLPPLYTKQSNVFKRKANRSEFVNVPFEMVTGEKAAELGSAGGEIEIAPSEDGMSINSADMADLRKMTVGEARMRHLENSLASDDKTKLYANDDVVIINDGENLEDLSDVSFDRVRRKSK